MRTRKLSFLRKHSSSQINTKRCLTRFLAERPIRARRPADVIKKAEEFEKVAHSIRKKLPAGDWENRAHEKRADPGSTRINSVLR